MSAESSFDVLVLGGGAAGCVLAARLSEDPRRRVCLVEAGPDYGRYADGRWPASLLDARVDGALTALGGGPAESHDWGFPGISASRARVIGGCSSHNGCEALWGSPADYDAWADLTGDRSWSYAGLAPYLRRATEALRVRPSVLGELSPIRRTIIDSGTEAGLPFLSDLNAPDALVGVGLIPVNAVGSVRWGAAFAYLDPARGRPNLTILADTLVDRVVVRNGRAEGAIVVVNGRAATLSAPLVVLAAGAFGSPAILQRSGIGDAGLLRNVGIPVVADIPAVGRQPLRPSVRPDELDCVGGRRARGRRAPRAVGDQMGVGPVRTRIVGRHRRRVERRDLRPTCAQGGGSTSRDGASRDARGVGGQRRDHLAGPDRAAGDRPRISVGP